MSKLAPLASKGLKGGESMSDRRMTGAEVALEDSRRARRREREAERGDMVVVSPDRTSSVRRDGKAFSRGVYLCTWKGLTMWCRGGESGRWPFHLVQTRGEVGMGRGTVG